LKTDWFTATSKDKLPSEAVNLTRAHPEQDTKQVSMRIREFN